MFQSIHPWLGYFLVAVGAIGLIVTLFGVHEKSYFVNLNYHMLKNKIISAINDPALLFDTSPISRIDLAKDNQNLHKYILIISANQRDTHYQSISKWWDQKKPSDFFDRSFDEVYIKEKEIDDEWFVHVRPSKKGLPDSVDKKHTWKLYKRGIIKKLKYLYEMAR